MPGLVSKAARLPQELSKSWKETDEQRANLSSLVQVIEEASKINEDVSKLLSPFSREREHRINPDV